MNNLKKYQAWPSFTYEEFKPSSHLLHMLMQAIGKLKLSAPFEPEWANVTLWVTANGITTGLIPYRNAAFEVNVDFINNQIICATTCGSEKRFSIGPTSVAKLTATLYTHLKDLGIDIEINPKPQEVPNPILFHEDAELRVYDPQVVNAWWRILVSSQLVLQRYHALFRGKTQPIGLMWGTLDLRDVRFNGEKVIPTGINSGYLRRNAMDEAQIEAGWWGGNELYPKAAYYSFTYPQPEKIEKSKIEPTSARWEKEMSEFILDYEDIYKSKNPAEELFSFFQSSFESGRKLAGWNSELIGTGKPV